MKGDGPKGWQVGRFVLLRLPAEMVSRPPLRLRLLRLYGFTMMAIGLALGPLVLVGYRGLWFDLLDGLLLGLSLLVLTWLGCVSLAHWLHKTSQF